MSLDMIKGLPNCSSMLMDLSKVRRKRPKGSWRA